MHWFPHHVLEHSNGEAYRYNLARHIMPWFAAIRMGDILRISPDGTYSRRDVASVLPIKPEP
jgi:hypothetical protein